MMAKKATTPADKREEQMASESESRIEDLTTQVLQLQAVLTASEEQARRAQADYQNLQRRVQEDRVKLMKMAGRSVLESILEPLDNLYLAGEQLKDPGLKMVLQQFNQVLKEEGLEEVAVMGKEFDAQTMDVVDKQVVDDPKQLSKVIKVMRRGYRLNGEVIRHAKVVIGVKE
jgi:molecular chaperone GrpE